MFTVKDISELAVQLEKNGQQVYRKAIKEVGDPALATMLQMLMEDEKRHADWFAGLAVSDQNVPVSPELEEMGRAMIKDALGNQSFSLSDTDFGNLRSPRDLIEVAVEFERDTVMFYNMLRDFVQEEEALACLDTIIAEEEKHIRKLRDFLVTSQKALVNGH